MRRLAHKSGEEALARREQTDAGRDSEADDEHGHTLVEPGRSRGALRNEDRLRKGKPHVEPAGVWGRSSSYA